MVAGVIVLWRFQVCHSYHPLWGACCSSALNHTFPMQCTALRVGPARTGREPDYSARVLDFDSLALSMSAGHRPFHGHPLLFMGVRGRTEVRNLNRQWWAYCFSSSRLLSAGCRGGACICTVGTVRGGSLQRGRRLSCVGGGRYVRPTCCRYNSRSCRRRSGPSFASASCTTGSIILVSFANLGPYTSLARH